MKKRVRVVGRRRWARLTQFLENVMETSGSERVRMTAALRLCDVLLARDVREQAEMRAAERSAGKVADATPAGPVDAATPEEETDAIAAARAFIAKVGNRAANRGDVNE